MRLSIMKEGFYPLCYHDDEGEMMSGKHDAKASLAYYSNDEFDYLFDKSATEIKDWFAKRKTDLDVLDYDSGFSKGPNNEKSFVLWGSGFENDLLDLQVFSFARKAGVYPDRFQDRESETDWLIEKFEELDV